MIFLLTGTALAQIPEAPANPTLASARTGNHKHFTRSQKDSTAEAALTLTGKVPGRNTNLTDRLFPNSFNSALTQGTGIAAFTYDGSATATVAIDQTFAPTWTGVHKFNPSVSGANYGVIINPAESASANNQVEAALHIAPNFRMAPLPAPFTLPCSSTGTRPRTLRSPTFSALARLPFPPTWRKNEGLASV